jgi:heterodisulfide reductase subunit D
MAHLSPLEEDIVSCSVCSFKYCRSACAVYDVLRSEAVAPSGFNHFALGILRNLTDYTPSAAEALYRCTDCGACRADGCVAPGYGDPIDTPNVILALRADAVERGFAPAGVASLIERLRRTGNPYGDPKERRGEWVPSELASRRPSPVYLWAGCTAYRNVSSLSAAAGLLLSAGVNLSTLGADEGCCGFLAWQLGERALAAQQARAAVSELAKRGVRELVVAEAGCYRLFKSLARREMGIEIPFEVYHLSEYIERLVEQGVLRFARSTHRTVAYHDPGQLGAQMGVYEAPRALVGRVGGIRLVEMPHNRAKARGSGQGAGFELLHPEIAKEVARRRLEDAASVGAEWLVTACPAEAYHIEAVAESGSNAVKVRELSQVLVEVIE